MRINDILFQVNSIYFNDMINIKENCNNFVPKKKNWKAFKQFVRYSKQIISQWKKKVKSVSFFIIKSLNFQFNSGKHSFGSSEYLSSRSPCCRCSCVTIQLDGIEFISVSRWFQCIRLVEFRFSFSDDKDHHIKNLHSHT